MKLPDGLEALLQRRSVKRFTDQEPSLEQIELVLQAAATVPDHGELRPYRFVVSRGKGRARFGDALAAAALERDSSLGEKIQEKLRDKAFAAPVQILIVYSPKPGMKIPEWEQKITASCTGYAITLAASLLGLGAIWKSAPILEGKALRDELAMTEGEELLGWVNLGVPADPPHERQRVDVHGLAQRLGGKGLKALGD